MITTLEVFTPGVYTPPLTIVDQSEALDYIQIKNIEGLGPVKANILTTQYGSIDGESLTGTSTPKRNIVITVGLNPDWGAITIESLRTILYLYFTPENLVTLKLSSTHMPTVQIDGIVEDMSPNLFSKDPEYQISIICPQPAFVAVAPTVITGVANLASSPVDISVNYQGNLDTGFVLEYEWASGSTLNGEIRVINKTPVTNIFVAVASNLVGTSLFRVSTESRNKYAREYPTATTFNNRLNWVTTGSSWPTLRKGVNLLQITTVTGTWNYTLTYYAKYGGL